MANDYENNKDDLNRPAGEAGTDKLAVDDPLLELARIVQKNTQLGANVSGGRVGNTDYFAGLDDFTTGADDKAPDPQPQIDTPASPVPGHPMPATPVSPPPVSNAPETVQPQQPLGPQESVAPLVGQLREQFFARQNLGETASPISPASNPPGGSVQMPGTHAPVPPAPEPRETFSSLWPQTPVPSSSEDAGAYRQEPAAAPDDPGGEPDPAPQPPQDEPRLYNPLPSPPATPEPTVQPAQPHGYQIGRATASPFQRRSTAVETQAQETERASAPSIDLEQNLSAGLEDELIGALRQSVGDEPATPSVSPEPSAFSDPSHVPDAPGGYADPFQDLTEPTPVASRLGAAVQDRITSLQPADPGMVEREVSPRVDAADTAPDYLAAQVTAGHARPEPGSSQTRKFEPDLSMLAPQQPAAPEKPAQPDTPVESAGETRRPAINESDLLAALSPAERRSASVNPPVKSDLDDSPAGIDALFADLDFPDPVDRKTTEPEPALEAPVADPAAEPSLKAAVASADAADNIDDMAWPAAANAVPQAEDDETPPPPGGYDLDAVARAMQESDPSLSGAGVLPPHPAAEAAAVPGAEEKSRKGLHVILGIVGIAVLGGSAFLMMDGDSVHVPDGPPPVIAGLEKPLKIMPDQSQPEPNGQASKLIYDRVNEAEATAPSRLVFPETTEPANLPPAPGPSENGADLAPGAPKQVRTLTFRPDGTIISGDDGATVSSAPSASAPGQEPATSAPVSPPTPVRGTASEASGTGTDLPSQEAPAVSAPSPVPGTPAIVAATEPAAFLETDANEVSGPAPSVLPRKKPAVPQGITGGQTAPAAAAQSNGPLKLASSAPSQAPAGGAVSASGQVGTIPPGTYIVQVTSQRTADAASGAYTALQRRFPGVLGNQEAVIVAADLGDRGVFYRARIPKSSREEAVTLCESLKGAGGDCFVRRQP